MTTSDLAAASAGVKIVLCWLNVVRQVTTEPPGVEGQTQQRRRFHLRNDVLNVKPESRRKPYGLVPAGAHLRGAGWLLLHAYDGTARKRFGFLHIGEQREHLGRWTPDPDR
jgi:hypothetical protein